MLVLTRLKSESLFIGPVKVIVVQAKGNRARLAFEAPRSISIMRSELGQGPVEPKQFAKDCIQILVTSMNSTVSQSVVDFMADEMVRLIGGAKS